MSRVAGSSDAARLISNAFMSRIDGGGFMGVHHVDGLSGGADCSARSVGSSCPLGVARVPFQRLRLCRSYTRSLAGDVEIRDPEPWRSALTPIESGWRRNPSWQ